MYLQILLKMKLLVYEYTLFLLFVFQWYRGVCMCTHYILANFIIAKLFINFEQVNITVLRSISLVLLYQVTCPCK